MRHLFTLILAVLAMSAMALAVLPAPEVQYFPDVPGLDLVFSPDGLFPPVGSAAWRITLERNGAATVYEVAPVYRDAFVRLDAPLYPGPYVITAEILDADEAVLDACAPFTWGIPEPVYTAELPRIAETPDWGSAIAMVCHAAAEPVEVTITLYYEDGTQYPAQNHVFIPVHGATAFYFSSLLTQSGEQFTGTACLEAAAPVAFQFMLIPASGYPVTILGKFDRKE